MNTKPDHLELSGEEVDAAISWHGGQSSMLYAVASTGALSRGTIRPYGDDGPLTDDEWICHLASNLAWEARDAAKSAGTQYRTAKGKERKELLKDRWTLISMAEKAEELIKLYE